MKFSVVCVQLPEREGSATGLVLLGTCEGLLAAGHDVELWCWGPTPPREELPSWARWEPLPAEPAWRTRARALWRPRADIVRARWVAPDDAIAVAEDPLSFAAVERARRSVVVVYYRTALDAPAVGRWTARDVQSRRNERRVMRAADLCLAMSERVKGRTNAVVVPAAYPIPAEALPLVEEPVAAIMADWLWPPNRAALDALVTDWPKVRARVPTARLVIAGRNLPNDAIGIIEGVEWLGEVAHATDLLARAAVVAFPCPPSSGPKVKTLQALAYGVPVVTTAAGAEGIMLASGEGVVVSTMPAFADALAETLADVGRRAHLAASGRAAVVRHHAPLRAAEARLTAYRTRFGLIE